MNPAHVKFDNDCMNNLGILSIRKKQIRVNQFWLGGTNLLCALLLGVVGSGDFVVVVVVV